MDIGRLGPTAALIAAIRGEKVRKTGDGRGAAAAPQATQPKSPAALQRQLAEIVRGLRPDDAASLKAARPQLVRAVLLWEFGVSFREHPDWRPMLTRIESRLDAADPDGKMLAQMVAQLQKEVPGE